MATQTSSPAQPANGEGPTLLTRRALLRKTGLVAGSVGVGAILTACAPAVAQSWTFAPSSPAPSGGAPDASAMAGMSMGPAATASPGSVAEASPSPLAVAGAHDPSPADFAIPPTYQPPRANPIPFALTSNDGPDETILISASPPAAYRSMNFGRQVPAPTLRMTEGQTLSGSP